GSVEGERRGGRHRAAQRRHRHGRWRRRHVRQPHQGDLAGQVDRRPDRQEPCGAGAAAEVPGRVRRTRAPGPGRNHGLMPQMTGSSDSTQAAADDGASAVDQAVAQGGAYEVLRRRLADQGAQLRRIVDGLNARRLEEFGDSRMEVAGRFRIRTENNCVGRDIVQVGDDLLLFGYNVYIGLKTQTRIEDVFALYRLVEGPDGDDVTPVDFT